MADDTLPDRHDLAERPWHAVSGDEAVHRLGRDGKAGLSKPEIQRRQQEFGENKLPEQRRETVFKTLLRRFKDPLIYMLLMAGLLMAGFVSLAIAFLVLARKLGWSRDGLLHQYPEIGAIPFESERLAVSFNRHDGDVVAHAKGAAQTLAAMSEVDSDISAAADWPRRTMGRRRVPKGNRGIMAKMARRAPQRCAPPRGACGHRRWFGAPTPRASSRRITATL